MYICQMYTLFTPIKICTYMYVSIFRFVEYLNSSSVTTIHNIIYSYAHCVARICNMYAFKICTQFVNWLRLRQRKWNHKIFSHIHCIMYMILKGKWNGISQTKSENWTNGSKYLNSHGSKYLNKRAVMTAFSFFFFTMYNEQIETVIREWQIVKKMTFYILNFFLFSSRSSNEQK